MTKPNLSIIIPCYNEQKNIERGVLTQVNNYLSKQSLFNWEVIVCNDESTDESQKLISDFVKSNPKFSLVNIKHGGKPAAVWAGIEAAKFAKILFTDFDQSTPLNQIEKLLPHLNNFEVVIGSRGTQRDGTSALRKIMSWTFRNFRKVILLNHLNDTQCGFKAMDTNLAKRLFPQLSFFTETTKSGWRVSSFDAELLFMAEKIGSKIKEVEVYWKNEDISNTKGDDMVRFKKESIEMLKEIFRVRYRDMLGKYEKI